MARKKVAAARTPIDRKTAVDSAGFAMREERFVGKILIRGLADDAAFMSAAATAAGVKAPTTPNTTATTAGGETMLWLGPSEWLLWTADDKRQRRLDEISAAVAGMHAAVVDVSDYYVVIRAGGARARNVLAHGCPLDLRPAKFSAGMCAQSRFRNAAVLIRAVDDAPTYDLQTRWSFAEYLWDYLEKVAAIDAETDG